MDTGSWPMKTSAGGPHSGEDCTAPLHSTHHEHPGWWGLLPLGAQESAARCGTVLGLGQSHGPGEKRGQLGCRVSSLWQWLLVYPAGGGGDVVDEPESLDANIPPYAQFLRP